MNIDNAELKKFLTDFFLIDTSTSDENLTFEKVQKWDSLKHVKLIINLEEKYKITINQNEIPNLISFYKIKNFLDNYNKV